MASSSQIRRNAHPSLADRNWGEAGESFAEFLRSFTIVLNNSTVGVALYDQNLHCCALNAALAAMSGVPATEQIGKTFRQIFGEEAREFEVAFHGVFDGGRSLPNFEFAAKLPATKEPRRWLANFYPINNESGRVRLVATTFSEVTRRSSLEQRLGQLIGKPMANGLREPSVGEEKCSELSTRSVELVKRSLDLIKSSMSLRCYVSRTRIEAGLMRRGSFLSLARGQRFMPQLGRAHGRPGEDLSSRRGSLEKSKPSAGGPSPREQQVVGLLAEGKSNKEMAVILELSTRTVEAYRARAMARLNLHSVAELVRYAVRNNLTRS